MNLTLVECPLLHGMPLQYEIIDKTRVQGVRFAERKYRKLKAGKIPLSPDISAVQHTIQLWSVVIKMFRGWQVHARTIWGGGEKLHGKEKYRYTRSSQIVIHSL